jgi:LacI family transcriptional regulator
VRDGDGSGGPLAEATIRDVAGLAGVSTATVSRVLNARDGVSPGTRERVRAAIHRLDFTPSIAAQRLRSGGSTAAPSAAPVVGVVAAVLDDWAGEVLKGVSAAAAHVALELVVVVGSGGAADRGADGAGAHWERRTLATLRGSVDGAVLLDPAAGPLVRDLPVVVVGRQGRSAVVAGPTVSCAMPGPPAEVGRAAVALLLGQVAAGGAAHPVAPVPRCVGG